jgi:Flp pilus assembly protein TadB
MPPGAPDCCAGISKPSRARRSLDAAGYIVPSAILVLLPKCPACIVAYLAMGAGIGVTLSTAATLRAALVIVCVLCLAYLTARQVRRRAG